MVAGQGLPCKDHTLFRSMGALVGKNSKYMGFHTLVEEFINTCWQPETARIAADARSRYFTELNTSSDDFRAALAA